MKLGFDYGAPPLVARYRAVFWEPVIGTGERVVALISLESSPSSEQTIPAGSYVVISPERLRAMLGRQRGVASGGVLNEVAQFLTHHQTSGVAIDHLELPFQGLSLGPIQAVRGYSIHQLVDAAVRTISAFGNAEGLFVDEDSTVTRHTVKTKQTYVRSNRTTGQRVVLTDAGRARVAIGSGAPPTWAQRQHEGEDDEY